jgi:hypothetical protein
MQNCSGSFLDAYLGAVLLLFSGVIVFVFLAWLVARLEK